MHCIELRQTPELKFDAFSFCIQGRDDRVKTSTRRSSCPAKIQLLRTDDYAWYISKFVKEHNHPLSLTCGEKREWKSHREIDDRAKDMIKHLRENNVPLTKNTLHTR
jgi:hypothetical protein